MKVFSTPANLQAYLTSMRRQGKTIGFVPTMGALHLGHIALIKASREQSDVTVCSIFVNPTQFNDPADLAKYPVTTDKDKVLLMAAGCEVLFLPGINDIYPEGTQQKEIIDIGLLGRVMEAAHRPGHFEGVMQVVKILLDIVQPDKLFMGEKDFQQCAVIRRMIRHYRLPVELVVYPTVREPDGLAMSSRNVRLTQTQRIKATILSAVLLNMQRHWREYSPTQLKKNGWQTLNNEAAIEVEYLELVDADTLRPIRKWEGHRHVQACVAARLGAVRLIDNVNIF